MAAGVRPVVYLGAREPRTVSEALAGVNAKSWSAVMDEEMRRLRWAWRALGYGTCVNLVSARFLDSILVLGGVEGVHVDRHSH